MNSSATPMIDSNHPSAPSLARELGGLRDRLESSGGSLSGGEQQMLAIGRALHGSPKFLLMDEPTEGLAPILAQEADRVILELKSQGISILLAEQNLKSALKLADYGSHIQHIREALDACL